MVPSLTISLRGPQRLEEDEPESSNHDAQVYKEPIDAVIYS